MQLNAYRDEAGRFLRAIHTENEPVETKIEMLRHELDLLTDAASKNGKAAAHQIYDLLFLLFEIAAQYNIDLDSEWASSRIRKVEKYC